MFAHELETIARMRGLAFDDASLTTLSDVCQRLLGDCDRIEELARELEPPPRVERPGRRPAPEENPVYGWVWKCEVEGSGSGPLVGRTVALKDNIGLAGAPLLNGSETMEGFVPNRDATVATRLLKAGATIIGKTAVPAFCCEGAGIFGYPEPLPVNPFDPRRLPGASSSGSAAVVVNGEADIALGGDQGGSIRIPASWCGCCGLKPTFGLVPYTGIVPIEMTLDVVGPLARTVRGCAEALAAIAGPDGLDPRQLGVTVQDYVGAVAATDKPLRVGVLSEGFGIPDASEPEVDARVRAVAAALRTRGHEVVEVTLPMHRDGVAIWNAITLVGLTNLFRDDGVGTNWRGEHWPELARFIRRLRETRSTDLPDTVKATLIAGDYISRHHTTAFYGTAQNLGRVLRARYDALLSDVDVLVMPTTPMVSPFIPVDMSDEERLELAIGLQMSNNVAPFNVTGHPSLTVPCQRRGDVPLGLLIVGRHFDDATVLHCGARVEEVVAGGVD
jgi:amidase